MGQYNNQGYKELVNWSMILKPYFELIFLNNRTITKPLRSNKSKFFC